MSARPRINNREFVVTYMNSNSIAEIAKNMNISESSVSVKAYYLRKLGVKLPKMRRSANDKQLEIAQLNSLIKKHTQDNK